LLFPLLSLAIWLLFPLLSLANWLLLIQKTGFTQKVRNTAFNRYTSKIPTPLILQRIMGKDAKCQKLK
jgi:hypothetical protein